MGARVRAVLFDLDDTLLDHAGSVRSALDRWLPEIGTEPTPALRDAWFRLEEKYFAAWRRGQISFLEQRRGRLQEFLSLTGQATGDLDLTFENYLRHYQAAWRPFADVLPTVRRLRADGLTIAILTNGAEAQQNAKVDAIGLRPFVRIVCTAAGLGFAKPDPRSFQQACAALGRPASQVLSVGDRYDLDVQAARAAGLRAIHLDRSRPATVGDPDRIATLTELAP